MVDGFFNGSEILCTPFVSPCADPHLVNLYCFSRFLAACSEAVGNRSRKSSSSSYTSVDSVISSSGTTVTANEQMPFSSPLIEEGGVITPLFSAASTNPSSTAFRFRAKEGLQVEHKTMKSQKVESIPASHAQQGTSTRPHYQLYPLKQSPAPSADGKSTTTSVLTTSSEIDFRNNLATLDADIARLQMQFKVARQSTSPAPRPH